MNCRNSHDLLGSLRLHRMDEVDACVISIRLALWDTFVIHFPLSDIHEPMCIIEIAYQPMLPTIPEGSR